MSDDFQFLLDAPGEAATKVQIAQIGDYKHAGFGDFSITADDVKDWQRNLSQLPGHRGLIDRDHRADKTPPGAPRDTEAFGWITGIDDPNDKGEVWATPEWTTLGKEAVADKRYLFFSPSYGRYKKPDGTTIDNTLTGGSLTNKPFMDSMATITLAAPERVTTAYEQLYSAEDIRLLDISAKARKEAAAAGNALDDGSYPIRNAKELHSAAVLAASGHGDVKAAKALIKKRAGELGISLSHLPGFADDSADSRRTMATDTVNADLLKLLDLPEDADETKILEAVTAVKEKADKAPEPDAQVKTLEQQATDAGKIVLDQAQWATTQLQAAEGANAAKQLAAERFDTAFDKAVRAGRAVPAQREEKQHFYTLDAPATLKSLDEGPVLVNVRASGWDNQHLLDADEPLEAVDARAQDVRKRTLDYIEAHNLPMSEMPRIFEQVLSGEIR